MKRRLTSGLTVLATVLLLMIALSVTAFAAEYNIDEGSVTISKDGSAQYVTHGSNSVVEDAAPVITQKDSTTPTGNTITVTTTGDNVAEFTVKNVNIEAEGDAIDIDTSNAKITLEGDNKACSETGSAIHVSSGDLTITGSGSLEADIGGSAKTNENAKIGSHEKENMSGSIHITGDATVTMKDDREDDYDGDGAGIGSGRFSEMSGDILIDGNANVAAFSQASGAGIGSGGAGKMSGEITAAGNAQITAVGGNSGAGIGSGRDAELSGTVTIGENAKITAWSEEGGAGIGTGYYYVDNDAVLSGVIRIGGNSIVNAGSSRVGIGAGRDSTVASTGQIIVGDHAVVTALSVINCGIGTSSFGKMEGTIIICNDAEVTAATQWPTGAAIGSGYTDQFDTMNGFIVLMDNASVATSVLKLKEAENGNNLSLKFNYDTKQIEYEIDENASSIIGNGTNATLHNVPSGSFIIGTDATINGVKVSGTDGLEILKKYVNYYINGEGKAENLTLLNIKAEDGSFKVEAEGQAVVDQILYNGSETVPTEPGTYPVTVVLKTGEKTTISLEVGELEVAESEPDPEPTPDPIDTDPIETDSIETDANTNNTGDVTSPETGDNSSWMLWTVLLLASAGAAGALTMVRRKRYDR